MFVATNTCLSQQMFCRDKHTFVATKDVFCRDKGFVATKLCLSRQRFCLDKNMFVAATVLSRQGHFCPDKRRDSLRQTRFCRDKSFVTTKVLSRQIYLWQLPPVIKNGCPNQASKQLTPNERNKTAETTSKPKRGPTCKHKVEKKHTNKSQQSNRLLSATNKWTNTVKTTRVQKQK